MTLPGTERPAGTDDGGGIAHPGDSISAVERQRVSAAYARYEDAGATALYSRFNPAHLFLLQECERRLLRALRRSGRTSLHDAKILEVGCGTGQWLRQLIVWGAQPSNLAGVDLLERRVEEARRLLPEGVALHAGSAGALPQAPASCDVVLQVTLFTSVLDAAERGRIAGEMMRVVKPSGVILWYDFQVNNPRNPDVRAVKAGEIRALFPSCTVELERITLAPPLARAIAPRSWLLAAALARVPWLCTHLLGVITPSRHA